MEHQDGSRLSSRGSLATRVSAALADAEVDCGEDVGDAFADVAGFIQAEPQSAEDDLSHVFNDLSASDRVITSRQNLFDHLAAVLEAVSHSELRINMRRRVANSLLRVIEPDKPADAEEPEKASVKLHPMESLADCRSSEGQALSDGLGSVLQACLRHEDEFLFTANAASFAFVPDDHRWLGSILGSLEKQTDADDANAEALANHLRFAIAVS